MTQTPQAPYTPGPDGYTWQAPPAPTDPKKKRTLFRVLVIGAVILALLALFVCVGRAFTGSDSGPPGGLRTVQPGVPDPGEQPVEDLPEEKPADGLAKFGGVVTFNDKSTLTVGKPVTFKLSDYHSAEKAAKYVKFKSTFVNKTDKVFDPTATTGAVSAGGKEGSSVYGEGLDAPDNKVLPGKSITWWMGYGVSTTQDLQLEVNLGFLDYQTVIFTS